MIVYLPNDKKETNKTVQRTNKSEDGQDRISLYGWNHSSILPSSHLQKNFDREIENK